VDNDARLQAEIEAIIIARMGNPGAAARRIVLIPRIRQALFYLDQRESMGGAPFNAKAGDDAR
jgi:hypothetical protein